MKNSIIENLKSYNFEGFITIAKLRDNRAIIPQMPGVYLVLRLSELEPQFLETGTGDFFKQRNPNVSIETLKDKWLKGESLLYIGKATNLNSRLSSYLKFGQHQNVGHWGGRFIWQLADANDLIICWKVLEDIIPRDYEKAFLQKLYEANGKLPFANLQK